MPALKQAQRKSERLRLQINGIVQGVGFRPFIYSLANDIGLSGFVSNTSSGVVVEIEGVTASLDKFLQRLPKENPTLSEIIEISSTKIAAENSDSFSIKKSRSSNNNETLISPDVSICDDCLGELLDSGDRRYLYPFINCTNCGPRYTIIESVPYDRPFTTMAPFKMCPQCQAEYDNPANRRFHAQPNACPVCGPQAWYENAPAAETLATENDVFDLAVDDLLAGKIIAVKGLGGFHLAVDATNEQAVQRLRQRKNREEKPLAVMVNDTQAAEQIAFLSSKEKQLLNSPQRPIVLLNKRGDIPLSEAVAPANRRLGVMLPYTPIHYILFEHLKKAAPDRMRALVMTSANLSEEPIALSNEDARKRLQNIADRFLMHNRDILVRADDSVMAVVDDQAAFFRRSRGYTPRPVFLKQNGPDVLAVGAELKSTVCFLKNERAFLSQHIGDLENLRANRFFEASIDHLQKILVAQPQALVCDKHPGYFSTQWAKEQQMPRMEVQHHHAHLASCLAEWQLDEPVIGIILDGTGFGLDNTIWGGEILIGDYCDIQRYAWLEPIALPGGEAAIRQPWRTALSYLYSAFGSDLPDLPFLNGKPQQLIVDMIDKNINSPLTSSCGRLFDAVAAMSGGRSEIRYEAQAAIELMQSVRDLPDEPFEYQAAVPQIPIQPLIRSVVANLQNGLKLPEIAGRFHRTLVELFSALAVKASGQSGLKKIVLSGGVFQNEILLAGLSISLKKAGFQVFVPRQVPANDGGIALGQAMIGRRLIEQGKTNVNYSFIE